MTQVSQDRFRPLLVLSAVLVRTRLLRPESIVDESPVEVLDSDCQELLGLASKHHVVLRALEPLCEQLRAAGNEGDAERLHHALLGERSRIQSALSSLNSICEILRSAGCEMIVIKSLDHWPDLGSDLDLFTAVDARDLVRIMTTICGARLEPRSWGDHLANKWNFVLPSLSEVVEIHVGRLGQTGEHATLGRSLLAGATSAQFGLHRFMVPAPEHRIILATLQRMYRHFYLRLCDVINTAELVESGSVDYQALETVAREAGIWPGVASYLSLVSDYVGKFRGEGLRLPEAVQSASRLRGDRLYFSRDFLRLPIIPESVGLYCEEVKRFLRRGDASGALRLSALPWLATAAAVGQKLTGSDKGIW